MSDLQHSGCPETSQTRYGGSLWMSLQVAADIVHIAAHEVSEAVRLEQPAGQIDRHHLVN